MNKYDAKKLAQYHNFTKLELHLMMIEAIEAYPDEYWEKPNYTNKLFSNGSFFNSCRKWLDYKEGVNDNEIAKEIISFRVLQCAGKFSKIQIPKKKRFIPEKIHHEIPIL